MIPQLKDTSLFLTHNNNVAKNDIKGTVLVKYICRIVTDMLFNMACTVLTIMWESLPVAISLQEKIRFVVGCTTFHRKINTVSPQNIILCHSYSCCSQLESPWKVII